MKNNITLVNSDWTGNKIREFYGIEPTTVYPPVPGDFAEMPWEKKENGFVCVGRISPGKRFETVIEIQMAGKGKYRVETHPIRKAPTMLQAVTKPAVANLG
ncbi:MAG: hypothetical protein L0Y68_03040, partial [Candidatus Dadabacteria bacterium]|nr:hypothetical protein [Candidatus Dadabacteria bacterium]